MRAKAFARSVNPCTVDVVSTAATFASIAFTNLSGIWAKQKLPRIIADKIKIVFFIVYRFKFLKYYLIQAIIHCIFCPVNAKAEKSTYVNKHSCRWYNLLFS